MVGGNRGRPAFVRESGRECRARPASHSYSAFAAENRGRERERRIRVIRRRAGCEVQVSLGPSESARGGFRSGEERPRNSRGRFDKNQKLEAESAEDDRRRGACSVSEGNRGRPALGGRNLCRVLLRAVVNRD